MPIKNPLRYPGAKSKLYSYIRDLLINQNMQNCTFYEPYAGSAAVSLNLLDNNLIRKAVLNELDPLIYNFWICVIEYPEELIDRIVNTPIDVSTWIEMSKYKSENFIRNSTTLDIGFAGLFLNRTNFSGILKANPLGGIKQTSNYPIDCRFNKESIIESIRYISTYRNRIEIHNQDAIQFMRENTRYKRNNRIFVYIDPPYYDKGPSLYRFYYSPLEHRILAQYIKSKSFPWLISYDDVPEIKKLYRNRKHIQLYLDYSVRTSRKGNELLISNLEIPPIAQDEAVNNVG